MPYLRLLEDLVRKVPGASGALMLDALGEVVVEAGAKDLRHRLIGAYQGITLSIAQRTAERYGTGQLGLLVCQYDDGALVLRPLKDGYYFVIAMGPGAALPRAVHLSGLTQIDLDAAL